jgi:hypothetical protein
MAACIAAFASIAVTVAFVTIIHVAAALPAPLHLRALHADASLQGARAYLKKPQQPAEQSIGTAALNLYGNTGKWTYAQLSVARGDLSATSLPNQGLALFAGGDGALL